MGYLKQFRIPFVGLGLGDHIFQYHIDNQFFDQFEHAVLQKGSLEVQLLFRKQETMLVLEFEIKGELGVKCDRCAGDFNLPVAAKTTLIIKLGDEDKELSENMVVINRNASEINVAQYIYEFVTLMLPQRIVHPDDARGKSTCDKETLKVISQLAGKPPAVDPRWEALKKLNIK